MDAVVIDGINRATHAKGYDDDNLTEKVVSADPDNRVRHQVSDLGCVDLIWMFHPS